MCFPTVVKRTKQEKRGRKKMVDLAPFLYLALVIDLVAGLVVAGICFLVGSYLYRKFSGLFRDPVSTLKIEEWKRPEIRTSLGISHQPGNV
jgi:hypothetical protein